MTVSKFEHMISKNAFLEYAYIFDNYYGTSREAIQKVIENGIDIFLDIDWQGAQQIRAKMLNVRSIFILPPSKKDLNYRLHFRSLDSEETIIKRMTQAVVDITHFSEYDYF